MISYRTRGLLLLHFTLQTVFVVGLFWSWVFVNFSLVRSSAQAQPEQNVIYTLVLAGSFLAGFFRASRAKQNLLELRATELHSLSARQATTAALFLLVYLVAARDNAISRIFLFSFLPLLYVGLFLSNKYLPPLLATSIFGGRRRQRTVLLGVQESALRMSEWLRRKASFGFDPVGLVTNESAPEEDGELPVLGKFRDLESVLIETRASQLIVLELPKSPLRISRLGQLCDRLGVRLLIINDLEQRIGRAVSFVEDGGFRFLSLREEPLECPFNQILKRALDIAVSLPVVLFVLPITSLIVSFWHRRQSPGPLLFKQRRTGVGGEEFLIYKYRTMHLGPFDESQQATLGDVRIFPAGQWLRKLSIDELPQFINVLKGEMSVVGPRPHLSAHDTLFSSFAQSYKVRALIKPGITGLAQVRGLRGATPYQQDMVNRVQSDLFYLENWSILLDARIIFKTAMQVISPPRSAY